MLAMFFHANKFNQDISNWKISKNTDTLNMFNQSIIKNIYKPKCL